MIDGLSNVELSQITQSHQSIEDYLSTVSFKQNTELSPPYPDQLSYIRTVLSGFLAHPKRLSNYLASREPLARKIEIDFYPFLADIEPNSRCNFRCTMCQVSEWKSGQRARDMTYEEFEMLNPLFEYLIEVKLHGMGEPLLHKNFFEIVERLCLEDIWVRTSINGSMLLANQNIERIIKSKLGEVQISIDGASKETFEKIRVRGKFEKVIEGVTILNREANASNRNLTRMWTVLQKQNVKEIEEFVSLAIRSEFKRLTFSISLNDWGQEFWKSRNNSEVVDFDDAVQRIQKQFSFARNEGLEISLWMQKGKYSHENTSSLCPWIFNRLYISSDSKLVPCAIIGNPEVSNLGDASRTINAWNGHQYRQFREAHISGNIPQCCVSCYESDDETRDKHVYRLQRNQTFVDLSRITFKD